MVQRGLPGMYCTAANNNFEASIVEETEGGGSGMRGKDGSMGSKDRTCQTH